MSHRSRESWQWRLFEKAVGGFLLAAGFGLVGYSVYQWQRHVGGGGAVRIRVLGPTGVGATGNGAAGVPIEVPIGVSTGVASEVIGVPTRGPIEVPIGVPTESFISWFPRLIATPLFTGVISSITGWLLLRASDEPENEVTKYLKENLVKDALSKYGWETLVKEAGPAAVRKKLESEIDRKWGLEEVWWRFGRDALTHAIQHRVIDHHLIHSLFLTDVKGKQKPLISRVKIYGEWLVRTAQFSPNDIAQKVAEDPLTNDLSIEELVDQGAIDLIAASLFPKRLLSSKILNEVKNRGFTATYQHYGNWWLDKGLVHPEDVGMYFRSDALATPDVVQFFNTYWDWPLKKFKGRIGFSDQEYEALEKLHTIYCNAEKRYKNKLKRIEWDYSREIQEADQEFARINMELEDGQNASHLQTEVENVAAAAKLTAATQEKNYKTLGAQTKKDSTLASLNAAWEEILGKVHENWARFHENQPLYELIIPESFGQDEEELSSNPFPPLIPEQPPEQIQVPSYANVAKMSYAQAAKSEPPQGQVINVPE